MEVLIETCLDDLYLLLINNNQIIDKILLIKFQKKSDKLPDAIKNLLHKNSLNINNITKFYVTKGPGSFMGIRAGLLFMQSLAGILNKDIYECNTFDFLQTDKYKDIYIKAGGKKFYALINNKPQLIEGDFDATKPNYNFIETNLSQILAKFHKINPFENHAFYMKKPTIG